MTVMYVIKSLFCADTWSLQDQCHSQDILKLVEGTLVFNVQVTVHRDKFL